MKGISHFVTGVAVGTLFPDAVQAAAAGSLVLVLGGIGGILPDTLDFKFARFMEEPDVLIDPHSDRFNAADIACELAAALDMVGRNHKRIVVKCNTMRLGPDWWQQYSVRFDAAARAVTVRLGPVVNTSQIALPESERDGRAGTAPVHVPLVPTYAESFNIDIFGGPSFGIEWRHGRVEIDFIPWHRQYSHSLFMALALGVLCAALWGATAGLIAGLALLAHVLEDQLGYLGSNLFWPFTRERSTGLGLIHASDPIPNLVTVGTMVMLILFNLDRFSARPVLDPVLYWGVLWLPFPLLIAYDVARRWSARLRPELPIEARQHRELASETQEPTGV